MAAGVADRMWEVEDLVAAWEAGERRFGKSNVIFVRLECVMKTGTGTHFKIYLMDKSRPDLEEGWIRIWSHKGERIPAAKNVSFDQFDQIPEKLRAELAAHNIKWPPRNSN
jgi:hypothetical protein